VAWAKVHDGAGGNRAPGVPEVEMSEQNVIHKIIEMTVDFHDDS